MTNPFEIVEKREAERRKAAEQPPLIRLWDGNWRLLAEVEDYNKAEFTWLHNDAGSASLEIPLNNPAGELLKQPDAWPTKSLYITCDKSGARWSGRIENVTVRSKPLGESVVDVSAVHDYRKLKDLLVWSNPFLPAEIQFPKAFLLFGPSRWVVATTLFVNLLRKNNSKWMIPDDPLNVRQWVDLDFSEWPIMVEPVHFFQDRSIPAVLTSRFKYCHDCVIDIVKDAQLTIDVRRYLDGDKQPIEGRRVKHGCLIVKVEDRSGWTEGTSFLGSLVSGLIRGVKRIKGDGLTEGYETLPYGKTPEQYQRENWRGTLPSHPWVVLHHGKDTGVEAVDVSYTPPGPVQFVTGGSSMPGVNEAIKASIIGLGGVLGSIFGQSQAGSVVEAIAEPLYSDTILAFQAHKMHDRIKQHGWDFPFEKWVSGVDKAYTISALSAMRKAKEETREKYSCKVKMTEGLPYYVGPQGSGDFFIGDRVAVHAEGMPEGKLFVEQVSKLTYTHSATEAGWDIEVGESDFDSGFTYMSRRLERLTTGLKELGVW